MQTYLVPDNLKAQSWGKKQWQVIFFFIFKNTTNQLTQFKLLQIPFFFF